MRQVSNQILNLLFEIRNLSHPLTAADQNQEALHREFQLAKIEAYMQVQAPIHMVLPAFPAKSPNPLKTLGSEPDLGEVLALQKLNTLCEQIATIYSPGAAITICSDGRVFSDVVLVSDTDVDRYGYEISEIIVKHGFKNLSTFSLEDVFDGKSYDEMRQLLTKEFAEDLELLRARTRTESDALALFNGIHRFMFEDQLALFPERSKNQSREKAKGLAYEVIRRSNAWSRVVEKYFPNSLRLSIHPQSLRSSKIGVRLLDSNDLWRTPWHSVTVFDGKQYYLAPRSEAEALGGVLKYAEDKYPFYQLPEAL
ncbi:isocyanide synthase family protein [Bdellovibrio sp. BCCA]|uniref:isocyanide synthase family protein n=1 Tax=Bdellovibrio sp. BCCA TaxID=3136281 RepID=UPI0030F2D1E9